jgi:hypothetical protein
MGSPGISGILSLLAYILLWYWCLYAAYPLSLDKKIKKGKSWLYIPAKWRDKRKLLVILLTPFFLILPILLSTQSLSLAAGNTSLFFISGSAFISSLLVMTLFSYLVNIHFRQQQDFYFYIKDQISFKSELDGKKLSNMEINNLASFQHQNFLQKADKEGMLLMALKKQTQLAKKQAHNRSRKTSAKS